MQSVDLDAFLGLALRHACAIPAHGNGAAERAERVRLRARRRHGFLFGSREGSATADYPIFRCPTAGELANTTGAGSIF
jgi:hypothetical protein